MRKGYRYCCRGFKLIELLVVVAIVAMLAALVFPALNQAKKSAKVTRSMSQMKQIISAQHIYNSDLDEILLQRGLLSLIESKMVPPAITRTGGNDILGFANTDVYMWIPPTEATESTFSEVKLIPWQEHVTNTGGNPVILLDITHDDNSSLEASPFRRRFAIAAFWDGHILRKALKGRPDDLRKWESY